MYPLLRATSYVMRMGSTGVSSEKGVSTVHGMHRIIRSGCMHNDSSISHHLSSRARNDHAE